MLSNTEKEFARAVIAEKYRLDGRGPREYRSIKIRYEGSKGCCFVDLGETKVVAQISWELSTPKDSRPNEGMVRVNVELSPLMGSFAAIPNSAPTSDCIIEINRLLERCLRESHCLDLESLCIESGTSSMTIKVDLHVLNHSGNLIDALVLAGIGALKHFRRPDVTYCGLETIVHTNEDRDPLPLNLLHIPVCTTFAFFSLTNDSTAVIMDPTDLEEKVCDWRVVIAANKQREICLMQTLGSRALTTADHIIFCCNLAIERAIDTALLIERSLKEDEDVHIVAKKYSGVCMIMEEDLDKMNISADAFAVNADVTDDINECNKKITDDDDDSEKNHLKTPKVKKQNKNKKQKTSEDVKSEPSEGNINLKQLSTTSVAPSQSSTKKKAKHKKASHTITSSDQSIGQGGDSAWDLQDG